MKQWFKNFMKIRTDIIAFWVGIFTFIVVGYIGWYFSNLDLTSGNMGAWFAYTELLIYGVFTIAFTIFIAATVYQIRYFARVNGSSSTFSGKTSGIGGIGGIFGMLVAGCPACSITVASYLGLASILSFLPRKGMELKVLGVLLVIWSAWSTVNKLETCQMKKNGGQEKNVLLSYIYTMNTSKILITLVAIAGIATSVRAIKDYQSTSIGATTANTLPSDTAPVNDAYVPQPALNGGGCGGGGGGCGGEGGGCGGGGAGGCGGGCGG